MPKESLIVTKGRVSPCYNKEAVEGENLCQASFVLE